MIPQTTAEIRAAALDPYFNVYLAMKRIRNAYVAAAIHAYRYLRRGNHASSTTTH